MATTVVRAAFNRGDLPKIVCFNQATTALGVSYNMLIAAMQKYVDQFVAPVWVRRPSSSRVRLRQGRLGDGLS